MAIDVVCNGYTRRRGGQKAHITMAQRARAGAGLRIAGELAVEFRERRSVRGHVQLRAD
jgi:hypothetical protein